VKSKLLLNLVFFQVSWWSYFYCAYSGNNLGTGVVFLLYSLLHFQFVSEHRMRDFKLMLILGILGYLTDLFIFEGLLFSMQHKSFVSTFWLFGMWWGFISSLPYGLKKILRQPVTAGILGALFGPISYWAGEKVGVLAYFRPLWLYYGAHGLFWGLCLYGFSRLEKRKII
jgi:hypothetical protein